MVASTQKYSKYQFTAPMAEIEAILQKSATQTVMLPEYGQWAEIKQVNWQSWWFFVNDTKQLHKNILPIPDIGTWDPDDHFEPSNND